MLSRTAAFDSAIVNGGIVVTECDIQRGGITIATIDLLPGAKIKFDDTASSRETFTGQLPNTGIAPHLATDTLAPFTIEAVVKTGMITPAQPTGEMLQLGVFRVNLVQDDTTGLITISGPDRSFVVANALNESPYTIAAGTPLDTAIEAYLQSKYPSMTLTADGGAHSQIIASTIVYQTGTASGDPWANCQALATEFGRELFIDNTGNAVLRVVPDPSTALPVWNYTPGTSNLAISGTHSMDTSKGVYNVAVVSGEGSGVAAPVTGTAEITDNNSPIFPSATGFGRRPVFLTSAQLTTQAQCEATAQALLNKQPGVYDQIQFTAIPHPAHQAGDVVSYESQLLGLQIPLVLAAWELQIDLQAPAQYTTRTAGAVAETVIADTLNATVT